MTFRSFPLSSDLVSFSDQSYRGVGGAHRMLMQISSDTHRLDASHNDLGTDGTEELFNQLLQARRRFSAPEGAELWGMTMVNLARNSIGDGGMMAAAYYVSKDLAMKCLLMQANLVTLHDIVDQVVERLNASLLRELSLTNNPLSPPAVIKLFETLHAPKLRELHLSTCDIPPACVPAICAFLRSPRSQRLGVLELNANALGRLGVTKILDAMEDGNFSISRIGLFANNAAPNRSPSPGSDEELQEDIWRETNGVWESDENMEPSDPRSMATQIERRVPLLQARNGELTRRVRTAAAMAIAPARILMHARAPTTEETAARVLAETKLEEPSCEPFNPRKPTRRPEGSFPLLELPGEVITLIARHCSGDAYALSDAQWTRVRTHAEDRSTLERMAKRMNKAQDRAQAGIGRKYQRDDVRREWLAEVLCQFWECETSDLL